MWKKDIKSCVTFLLLQYGTITLAFHECLNVMRVRSKKKNCNKMECRQFLSGFFGIATYAHIYKYNKMMKGFLLITICVFLNGLKIAS